MDKKNKLKDSDEKEIKDIKFRYKSLTAYV